MIAMLKRMDTVLLLCLLGFAILGMLTLYAAVHQGGIGLWQRQIIYWLLGLGLFFTISYIPLRMVGLFAWPGYVLTLIALALVPLLGDVQMGARRWLNLGFIYFQPSELMKWALMLVMAHWFASRTAASFKDLCIAVAFTLAPGPVQA